MKRDPLKSSLADLAARGIYLGTSSWKYPGWLGQLYDENRYVWRGRFSESRFERACLPEYAEVFKTVCVDGAYYKFPDQRSLGGLVEQVPDDFLFAFKVTDEITIKRFPQLPRFGSRAGQINENFLNADLFAQAFLKICEPHRKNVGLLIFEFSRFGKDEFARGREFVEVLDRFLGRLPKGWRYGVEIRNRQFLHSDYFSALQRHGVAHIFNSWTAMPALAEQMAIPGSRTAGDFCGARLLLRPGRNYQDAVSLFSPYREIKDPYPDAWKAAAELIRGSLRESGRSKVFIYVNNRLEGNALETISAILSESLGAAGSPTPAGSP